MFTKIEYRPNVGSPLEVNTLTYPVQEFSPVVVYANKRTKKMQQPGSWPTYNYPEGMEIEMAGDIVGSSFTAYVTARLAFMTAFQVPLTTLTTRKHGVLRIRMDGMGEDADADVQIVSCEAPMDVDYPTATSYRVSFFAFYPAFIGASTTEYRI